MREKWVIAAKRADFKKIGEYFGIDPVIARMMRNRGLTEISEMETYLHGTRADLYDPHLLKDVDLAAEILLGKIREKKKIRIIGDYDVDGIQSTYILFRGLGRLGAVVDYELPHRMKDGYGLNKRLVTEAHGAGVDTLLTCDNGISAAEQIRLAKHLGMTVIITDHHDVPFEENEGGRREILPPADAVVNPKQKACPYPCKKICGAAVAFKLIQVLYEQAGVPAAEADAFIENAGFATVADVMELQGENRLLVRLALPMLEHTKNIGMRALILQNELDGKPLKCHHIGFVLGPCLNAPGRLESAKLSLKLLLTENPAEAAVLAKKVRDLNALRKTMTEHAVQEAKEAIEQQGFAQDKVLVIFLPDCHESIAGIVAGRIREAYYRPVFIVTRGAEGAKGSARSIDTYSMYEEMCKCREFFTDFGGHPKAAGFSMREEDIDLLRRRLNELTTLTEEQLLPKVTIDAAMPADYVSLHSDLPRQLELLEPFGEGNRKPVFADRNLAIRRVRIYGETGRVVKMDLRGAKNTYDAVYFGDSKDLSQALEEKYGKATAEAVMCGRCRRAALNFLYYPEINNYYGTPRLQLKIQGFC